MHQSPLDANLCRSECKKYKRNTTIRTGGRAAVVGQFDCHPEQALFAQRRIWASRATWRGFSATIIARLARFLVKLTTTGVFDVLLSAQAGSSQPSSFIFWLVQCCS